MYVLCASVKREREILAQFSYVVMCFSFYSLKPDVPQSVSKFGCLHWQKSK